MRDDTEDKVLRCALLCASVGLRVIPITPGRKHPPIAAWQDAATVDAWTIRGWWEGPYADHGVGLALGALDDLTAHTRWVFAVDIDRHEVDGEEEWAALCAEHGDPPETVEAVTGGGGRHLLFEAPHEVRNGRLAPGVDIRGAGGQIVVEPSIHPTTGQPYAWVDGLAPWECGIAAAPGWLIEALARPVIAERSSSVAVGVGDRPGDRWAAATSWATLLERDGWTLHHVDRSGEHHWTRPGKDTRDGTSATTDYGGADLLKVFTSSLGGMGLEPEATYSRLGYLAATRFSGDHSAAARWLAAQGWGTPEAGAGVDLADLVEAPLPPIEAAPGPSDEGWPIASSEDIDAILSGEWVPPTPSLLRRSDGAGLLYPGKVHSLAGEPGGGKTWVALMAAAQVLADGGSVLWLDWEDRLDTAVRRLMQLGVKPDALRGGRFAYVEPTFAVVGGGLPRNVADVSDGCALVVLDSMGEALAHSMLDQNSDGEVATWMARTARRLADGGAAVLILDHVVKDSEARGRWAIGSQRKLAAIDGAAYGLVTSQAFTRDAPGRAAVKCSKDRGGNYQAGATVAEIVMAPDGAGGVRVVVRPPDVDMSGTPLLTELMERVSRYLEQVGEMGASGRMIEGGVRGRGESVRTALRQLVDLGFAERVGEGRAASYVSLADYRDDLASVTDDTKSIEIRNRVHRVPPRPDDRDAKGNDTKSTEIRNRVHRVPPRPDDRDAVDATPPNRVPSPTGDAVGGGVPSGAKSTPPNDADADAVGVGAHPGHPVHRVPLVPLV